MKLRLFIVLLSGAFASSAFSASVYSAGHGDIGIAYEDEGGGPEFFLHYHLSPTATVDGVLVGNAPDGEEAEPTDVITVVPASVMISLPNDVALVSGTGVAAGDSIWVLPQSQQSDVPFLGVGAEELSAGEFAGAITFTLGSVVSPSGSGHFSAWQSELSGAEFDYSTNDPGFTGANNVISLTAGNHDHFNYGFSEPGTWQVDLTVAATHATDGNLSSTRTFTFNVVPEPSSALLAAIGGLALMRRRRA